MPKISQDRIQQRLVDRDHRLPQLAEQLVEVPTVLSLALLQQQLAEQTVDIPVSRRGGSGSGGPQSFNPEQSSTAFVEQLVDIPVPGGGLHDSLLDPGSSASSAVWRDEAFQGFSTLFPDFKKGAQSGRQVTAGVVAHSSS